MEKKQSKIKGVFCPMCGESLIFPDPKWTIKIGDVPKTKIFLTSKTGRIFDRVLCFKIVRSNGEQGFIELSIEPGDYSKYVSLTLHSEEQVTFIHPHCHKAMNGEKNKEWVKILVQHEDATVWEYFIHARYGIEVTMCKKDGDVTSCYGNQFKSLAEYFQKEWKKIKARKGRSINLKEFCLQIFLLFFVYKRLPYKVGKQGFPQRQRLLQQPSHNGRSSLLETENSYGDYQLGFFIFVA